MNKTSSQRHLVIIVSTVILALLAIGIPLLVPNGTERFSGAEKLAAQRALDSANDFYKGENMLTALGTLKIRVTNVLEVQKPQGGAFEHCTKTYRVMFSHLTFFGITAKTDTQMACV